MKKNILSTQYICIAKKHISVSSFFRHIVLVFFFYDCQCLLGQYPITHSNNIMRSGDVLKKIRTNFVRAGEVGQNKVWAFGQVTEGCKYFNEGIVSRNDTITIFENNCIHHYLICGDSLLYKGWQQRHSFMLYDTERLAICYPFSYGDSISSHYSGHGIDDGIGVTINGWGYSLVDGTGNLTDGKDTLYHITRIRQFDDYTEKYDTQVIIHIRSNRYLWYNAGSRYPVMESRKRVVIEDSVEIPVDSVTFVYLPTSQRDLSFDAANDLILRRLCEMGGDSESLQGEDTRESISNIHATVSEDRQSIFVNYELSFNSVISIVVCDVMGYVLGCSSSATRKEGSWQEYIPLSRKPIANVFILNIQCNGKESSIKVYN